MPMPQRVLSVSTAPYDGYPLPLILESLIRIGATHLEPAFIAGYTDPFGEDSFLPSRASEYRRQVEASGLECLVMSSHMDLGSAGATGIFTRRMDFAAGIGASIIATTAAPRHHADNFFRNMDVLLAVAEKLNVVIALENPGDGSDNLFNTATDGVALVARFDSPFLRLNYDAANTASHHPALSDFAGDAIRALPVSAHAHIKDVLQTHLGWFFTAIGDGLINCARILDAIRAYPCLPISIELPLRFHRDPDAQPVRRVEPVPVTEIEKTVVRSLSFVREHLKAD